MEKEDLDKAIQQTVDYLYKIDGEVTKEEYIKIGRLRQLINEEFVAKGKNVSSQLIYDILYKEGA